MVLPKSNDLISDFSGQMNNISLDFNIYKVADKCLKHETAVLLNKF